MVGYFFRHFMLWCIVPWLTGFAFAIAIAGVMFLVRAPSHPDRLDVVFLGRYIVVTPSVVVGMIVAAAATAVAISMSVARRIIS
jgi:hypothetical protein